MVEYVAEVFWEDRRIKLLFPDFPEFPPILAGNYVSAIKSAKTELRKHIKWMHDRNLPIKQPSSERKILSLGNDPVMLIRIKITNGKR